MRSIGNLSATNWRDLPAIARGLVSGSDALLDGAEIGRYESDFEAFMGGGHAVSFRAARMGLSAILQAAGLQQGDEVLITGFTCVVVPNAAIFMGYRPVYVDIDPWTYNMDIEDAKAKLTDRTRAIVVQSSFGMPADLENIIAWARENALFVIEDNALSLGASHQGRLLGRWGDAAIFSSEQTKSISTAKGGVAYTTRDDVAGKLRAIQADCAWPDAKLIRRELGYMTSLALIQGPRFYHYQLPEYYLRRLGLIYLAELQDQELVCTAPPRYMQRLTNSHARVGRSQLRQLPAFIDQRAHLARFYREQLGPLGYRLPRVLDGAEPSMINFPVLVKDREHIRAFFMQRRINVSDWFQAPVHPASIKPEDAFYAQGSCPNAEKVSRHVINFPTHIRMNDGDAHRLIDTLKAYNAEYPDYAPDSGDPQWPL